MPPDIVTCPLGATAPSCSVRGDLGAAPITPRSSDVKVEAWRGEVLGLQPSPEQGSFHEFSTHSRSWRQRALRQLVWFALRKHTDAPGLPGRVDGLVLGSCGRVLATPARALPLQFGSLCSEGLNERVDSLPGSGEGGAWKK